ncbi:hypothetical protein HYPSUDRAFT_151705, partial [Hypholoma sublateritium FD-334 SS-4]
MGYFIATRNSQDTHDAFVKSYTKSSLRKLREQLRNLQDTHPNSSSSFNRARTIQNLADVLLNRFIGMSRQDDLQQAIWFFEHALALTPRTSYRHLEIMLGLSTSLYARFRLSGQTNDRERLL